MKKKSKPLEGFEAPDAKITHHWKDDGTAFYLMIDMTDKSVVPDEKLVASLRALATSLEDDLLGPGLYDMEPLGNA